MPTKTDYILELEHKSEIKYLGLEGLSAALKAEDALGFATIEEAEEARSKLNLCWRCGAVIRRRRITSPEVEVSAVW